jgi:PAS domain S-box-containing protein
VPSSGSIGNERTPSPASALRRLAEERLAERAGDTALAGELDALRLLHDLEVHEIELELQNEELRASRLEAERLATLYTELHDFAPVGYATLAEDGTICTVNFAAANLLGIERSNLVGKRFPVFVRETDRTVFNKFLGKTLKGRGEHAVCELELDLEHTEPTYVRLTATAAARSERGILVAMEDVSDERKKDASIREGLRLLNLSQRLARFGTFTVELLTGKWTSSIALDELLGVIEGYHRQLAGFLAIMSPPDREWFVHYLRTEVLRGERLEREIQVMDAKSGEVRWLFVQGDVEYDGMDAVRLVGSMQDVTERKRLQEERTGLLQVAQTARAEAEAANRSKDAFLATLSHELRNPLAPITSGLAILERSKPGSDPSLRAISVIERQVRHLVKLVDDLLDSTRIARGKVQLRRTRLDLNELAESLVEDHRSLFEGGGVRLELRRSSSPVWVEGDANRLAQVLGNLLQNSAKFCQRGGLTRLEIAEEPGGRWGLVRLSDDGVGIAPEVLPKLFRPFVQADTTLARSKGGLGLGMALAKQLVELHGGEIAVKSDGLGKGTEFVVRLLLAPPVRSAPASGDSGEKAVARRRVLIIEDNVDAAEMLHDLLEMQGQEVSVAHDGPEGLAGVRDAEPEIVLCDIGLPGMDGYEVARAIRAGGPGGPYLVALSGYALPEDVRHAEESGFQRHLAKPPQLEDIDRILAEAPPLARKRAPPSNMLKH